MIVHNRNVIVCDVDDTLILWDEKSRDLTSSLENRTVIVCPYNNIPYSFIVHQRHVDFLRREKQKGSFVIVWSRSDGAWAEAVVKALNLEVSVDMVMSKPVKFIDDKNNLQDILGMHLFLDKDGHSI